MDAADHSRPMNSKRFDAMRSIPLFLLLFVALRIPAAPFVVTSLKDSGRGTLREALSQGNRHITFQVGGTIRLKKLLEFRGSDVVIDGASAPGPGITVRDSTFSLFGARNVTIRHLRFRWAKNDSFRIVGSCRNILIENCSATHGGDGALDISHDYKTGRRPDGITVRRCLIAATDKAMLVFGVDNLTLEQNLFTNTGQRNPQLHESRNFNLINNVVRNFTVYGVRARANSTGNAVGNIVPLSPLLPKRPDRTFLVDHKSGQCQIYTADNVGPAKHDPNRQGNSKRSIGNLPLGIHSASKVERTVLANVGARPLDKTDRELVINNPRIKFRPSNTSDK